MTQRLRCAPNRFGAVYRAYNDQDELLYIGVTENPSQRHARHKKDRDWWHEVAYLDWEFYATYGEAVDVERDAIEAEQPRYNVARAAA